MKPDGKPDALISLPHGQAHQGINLPVKHIMQIVYYSNFPRAIA